MKRNSSALFLLFSLAVSCCFLAAGCGNVDDIAGRGGTDYPNTFTIAGLVVDREAMPLGGAIVVMVPFNYNPARTDGARLITDTTDTEGRYTISAHTEGIYCINVNHAPSSGTGIVRNVHVTAMQSVEPLPVVIDKPGTVMVPLDTGTPGRGDVIYVPGTQVFARIDSAALDSGFITLNNIPAHTGTPVVWSPEGGGAEVVLADSVRVEPSAVSIVPSSLPAPWKAASVGETPAGGAGYVSGRFIVNGGGPDIWDSADGFQFVYQPLASDGEITARVVSLDSVPFLDRAGIMVRQSLDPGAVNIGISLIQFEPYLVEVHARTTHGGSSDKYSDFGLDSLNIPGCSSGKCAAPVWLRLARVDSTVSAAVSKDGHIWKTIARMNIPFKDTVLVGLAVTSHDSISLTTAVFDSVEVR
jgi:regulation of enolase protein 1 (concanavalin A-like superfamily)